MGQGHYTCLIQKCYSLCTICDRWALFSLGGSKIQDHIRPKCKIIVQRSFRLRPVRTRAKESSICFSFACLFAFLPPDPIMPQDLWLWIVCRNHASLRANFDFSWELSSPSPWPRESKPSKLWPNLCCRSWRDAQSTCPMKDKHEPTPIKAHVAFDLR